MKNAECKLKRLTVLFTLLSMLVTVFIFGNSLRPAEVSNELSGGISEFFYRLPFFRKHMDEESFHVLVRKTAHFVEFAALGLCVTSAASCIGELRRESFVSAPLLVCLLISVCDELVQSFTDRTSSVKDVLLDFSGSVFALCLVVIAARLLRKRRNIK